MSPPLVVLEVKAPDAPPRDVAALVAACDAALGGRGSCVLGGAADRRVVIRFPDAGLRSAELELTGQAGPARRTLSFASEDAPVERLRAVGVVVAALVIADVPPPPAPSPAAPAPAEPAPPASAAPPAPPSGDAPAPRRVALEVLFAGAWGTGGTGGDGLVRYGPRLRVVPDAGPLRLLAGLSYEASSRPADVRAIGAFVGVGVPLVLGSLALVPRAEIGASRDTYSVTLGRASESTSRWHGAGRLGLDLVVPARGALAGVFGIETTLRRPESRIVVRDTLVGMDPGWTVGLVVGLRVAP